MPFLRLLALLSVLAALLLAQAAPAAAQEGDALRFFQQNPQRSLFRRDLPTRRVAPAAQSRVPARDAASYVPRRRPQVDPAATPEDPAVPLTAHVHVLGDQLGELLAQGLKEHFVETRRGIGVVRRARASSGLVRDDYYDWPKALREMLAAQDKAAQDKAAQEKAAQDKVPTSVPAQENAGQETAGQPAASPPRPIVEKMDMLVLMIGSNDRQALRDETGVYDFNTERWREIYARRLDDLLNQAREKRIPMLVVGMPVMQSQKFSADMLALNGLLKERAARGGAVYVDIWESFATEQGQYSAQGPDLNGEIVRLRTNDGVNFTKAGARKLGFFVAKDVTEQLGRERPIVEVAAALPTDLSEQIRRDAPGLVPQSLVAAVPLPELPELPQIGVRPLAGPVLALTNPPASPGGVLLDRRILFPANEMGILAEQALAYGRPPPAKQGRADDFAWPRGN
jgi:hypothetical protein